MSVLIEQIDKALAQYYEWYEVKNEYFNDEGDGLFAAFCDQNGLDDYEQINEELAQSQISDCILLEAFEDIYFPGLDANKDKKVQILNLLRLAVSDPDSFTEDSIKFRAFEVEPKDWIITEKEEKKALKIHREQASKIFDEGMMADKSIKKLVTISHKLSEPYLQYLCDMYTRDMIIMMTKKNAPPSYSPEKWASTTVHILELDKNTNKAIDVKTIVTAAVKSWFHRINPIIILSSPKMIQDSLQHVCARIAGMVELVKNLAVDKRNCPFQYDAIIAFDKVKNEDLQVSYMEQDRSVIDGDDDDSDGEEQTFYDCLDNVPLKLKQNNCLFIKQKVIEADGSQFAKFKRGPISQKYKGKELENYPRKHRFCSILDRRSANKEKDICDGDELIFYETPNGSNSFPPNAHVPMFYFETSRTCVLPGYADFDDEKNSMSQKDRQTKGLITSLSANQGGTLLFSFHVESAEEIRCYVYVNGQAFRFLPKDIRLVLPKLFDMEWGNNKKWIESKECDALIDRMNKQLRDVHFKAFLKKYRNKIESFDYEMRIDEAERLKIERKIKEQQLKEREEKKRKREQEFAERGRKSITDEAKKFEAMSDLDIWIDYNDVEQKVNALHTEFKSLHQFSKNDVCNQVKWWLYNDIDYKKNLGAIMSYFCDKDIDGKFVCGDYWSKSREIINEYLKKHTNLETDTINIMFEGFEEWIKKNQNDVLSKSALEIGLKFFSFPLMRLLNEVNVQNINGETFIQYHKNRSLWMKKVTGWNEADIYQINAQLFKKYAFNANDIKSVFDKSINFMVESNFYSMRNNQNVKKLNAVITQNIKKTNKNVMKTYDELSKCFLPNVVESQNEWKKESDIYMTPIQKMSLTLPFNANWDCAYCRNFNRVNYTNKKIKIDTSICTLCGIRRKDSVILRMRGFDNYFLQNEIKIDENEDEIIKQVQKGTILSPIGLDISCPDSLDEHKPCQCILKVAKYLIQCKRSIDFIHGKSENSNMKEFKLKNVSNEMFEKIYIGCVNSKECAEIMQKKEVSETQRHQILRFCNDEMNIQKFLEGKISFNNLLKQKLNDYKYSFAIGSVIYKLINECLQKEAMKIEKKCFQILLFGLSEIKNDIKHILDAHIKKGNKITREHTLKFFNNLIHHEVGFYDECEPYLKQIREKLCDMDIVKKDVLLMLHSNYIDDEKEEIMKGTTAKAYRKNRFLTDAKYIKYGFGVYHKHSSLAPIYDSLMEEMCKNKVYKIEEYIFERKLFKAIGKQKKADDLVCQYFDVEFNVIRNEIIEIIHVLGISLYTDLTKLCTEFRATYRRIDGEWNDDQVTARHREFYHFGRALFEAIEFFGQQMSEETKVYHGLNQPMYFEQFTAYFSQPMSTTPILETAKKFAKDVGIILHFVCGVLNASDVSRVPKYLPVKRFSAFPEEEELLFYGESVRFQIHDIYHKNQSHREYVGSMNILQKIVNNQIVNLDTKKDSFAFLISMIKKQKEINTEHFKSAEKVSDEDDEKEQKSNSDVNEYGQALFEYFCNNQKARSVEIKQFESLPKELKNELFSDDASGNNLSFAPIFILFGSLKTITFTDSCVDKTDKSNDYIEAAFQCIKVMTTTFGRRLSQIKFQSKSQTTTKKSFDLKRFEPAFNKKFRDIDLQWGIKYEFQGGKHNVIFTHREEMYIQELRSEFNEKIQQLTEEVSALKQEISRMKEHSRMKTVTVPNVEQSELKED